MTAQFDIERLLDGWAAQGPTLMPDGFLASVAEGIAHRPQRVTWRARGSIIPARSLAAFAASAVAIALIAVIGSNLVIAPPVGSPTPSPSAPSQSPTATASPGQSSTATPGATTSAGPTAEATEPPRPTPPPVAPGTYTMHVGPLDLTFTLPDGWALGEQGEVESSIGLASDPWNKSIDVIYDVYPPRDNCGMQADWTSPHSARDFLDHVVSRPIWSGTVEPTEVGGLRGWHLDGQIADGTCDLTYTIRWSDNIPFGVGNGPGPFNVYVLDTGHQSTLLIEIEGDGDFLESARAVIDTFDFSDAPLPTPAPTPTPLAAGTYSSQVWQPQVSFTVPDGWTVSQDGPYSLVLASAQKGQIIELLRDSYQPTPDCKFADDWASPHPALDFIHKLQARPNWYGTITPVFMGGLEGWRVDGVLYFEGCDVTYTAPSADGAPMNAKRLGHWSFYVLDDGRGSTILINANRGESFDETAQSVVDTFHFVDVPPAKCNAPGLPAPPSGGELLDFESAFWLDSSDDYKYVVLATGRDQAVATDAEVALFNACGAREQHIVNMGTVQPGETHLAVGSVNPGFVPVRMEVHQSTIYAQKALPQADCTRRTDGGTGSALAAAISTSPYLVDLYFDAAAIYRNASGALIGADKVSLLHPGTGTRTTEFSIPRSIESSDIASVDFVCYGTAFEW